MHTSSSHFVIVLDFHLMMTVMYVLIILLFNLVIVTLCCTIYKRKISNIKNLWQTEAASLINASIFYAAGDDEYSTIISRNKALLQNGSFRQFLINEIISAKKELSGSSAVNLKTFYETNRLNNDSLKKLKSKKWHMKAKAMQELGIMEQKKGVREILRLANHKNDYLRNEAQCALVNLYGFSGLRFHNIATYPVSEWQQIQLLNKLNGIQLHSFEIIKKWLQSPNDSIVVFALKLATIYHSSDLYENIARCLPNANVRVKINTLQFLKENPREDTPDILIEDYAFENKTCRLVILDTLKEIGNEKHIAFLLKQLHDVDDDIKIAAAEAVSGVHPSGYSFLRTHLFANENPWKAIFLQIENEHAA